MIRKFLLIISALAFIFSSYSMPGKNPGGGKGHKIEVQIKGVKDTTLILGYHYGSKKLVADTIRVDATGKGFIEGDTLLAEGMYLILTPDLRFFEIIIDNDQYFSLVTDTSNLYQNLVVTGSEANTVFNNYQKFSAEIYTKRKPIIEKLKYYYGIKDTLSLSVQERKQNRDSIAFYTKQLESVKAEMLAYEDNIIKTYPNSLLASVLSTMREIEIPDFPRNEKGEITDSLFKYTYMKKHFFDGVNFGDERLLRTPVYEMKIDQFFDRELIQIPDSIIPQVDMVMKRILTQEGKGYEGKMYYSTLHHLFMKYQTPKYMGLDNIFVYIMEQYYITNKIPQRVVKDTAYMKKINERYEKMSKNRIGSAAQDLQLYTNNEQWIRMNQIKADYIVLYFWDIDCGHCKKTIPVWQKYYTENKLNEKGVVTLYVYTQTEMDEWKKVIPELNLATPGVIHAFDPYQNTNFRTIYDVYSTPVSYIIDKNRKIIAKRLPPETLLEVIGHELHIEFEIPESITE